LPLFAQETFCFRPRVITLNESTQIRWSSRGSGRGGWSGRAVAQRMLRVSKLVLKRLSDSYSNEIAVEAVRGGQWAELKGYSY
jgi:hypothetical protein